MSWQRHGTDLDPGGVGGWQRRQVVLHQGVDHAEVDGHVPQAFGAHRAGVVVPRVLREAVRVYEVAARQLLRMTAVSCDRQRSCECPWGRSHAAALSEPTRPSSTEAITSSWGGQTLKQAVMGMLHAAERSLQKVAMATRLTCRRGTRGTYPVGLSRVEQVLRADRAGGQVPALVVGELRQRHAGIAVHAVAGVCAQPLAQPAREQRAVSHQRLGGVAVLSAPC